MIAYYLSLAVYLVDVGVFTAAFCECLELCFVYVTYYVFFRLVGLLYVFDCVFILWWNLWLCLRFYCCFCTEFGIPVMFVFAGLLVNVVCLLS